MQAWVTEFTDTYRNPKILFAAVYPAIANGAKRIYRGLEQHIGKIDHCTLDSCRKSYLKDLFQIFHIYGQTRKTQLIASLCLIQASENKDTGDQLRNHGSDSDTCHT